MQRLPKTISTLAFTLALVGFAASAHQAKPSALTWICLCIAGITFAGSLALAADPWRTVLGRARSARRCYWTGMAIGLAIVAASGCRFMAGRSVLVEQLTAFTWVAMAIGSAEEFVWRGWMFGSLTQQYSLFHANLGAAASHTAYKTALFLFPPAGVAVGSALTLLTLAAMTFAAGLAIGVVRAREGTILPAVAFHVVFDALVYGDFTTAPWWVY